ncbi:MAG: DUF4142 domain-containing protein [Steroidobacteraceae bacterium]
MKKSFLIALAATVITQSAIAAEPATPDMFVTKASEAGMAEVELGKLAVQKGSSADVREFGQRMVTDHSKAGAELEAIALKKSLAPAKALSPAHAKALMELKAKSGKDFDAAYAQQMVADHKEAVALFTSATSLTDKDLAGFAAKTLPVLKEHQQHSMHLPGTH